MSEDSRFLPCLGLRLALGRAGRRPYRCECASDIVPAGSVNGLIASPLKNCAHASRARQRESRPVREVTETGQVLSCGGFQGGPSSRAGLVSVGSPQSGLDGTGADHEPSGPRDPDGGAAYGEQRPSDPASPEAASGHYGDAAVPSPSFVFGYVLSYRGLGA